MAAIWLIRHGQASFGSSNYDVLSDTGRTQAGLLGDYLNEQGVHFDAIFSGTLERQRDTAQLATRHDGSAPARIELPGLNEYDAEAVFSAYLGQLGEHNPELLAACDADGDNWFRNKKLFQQVLMALTDMWLAGHETDHPELEPWPDFQARTLGALKTAVAQSTDADNIALFSSGGVISACIGQILELNARRTVELSWSLYNGSISELRSRDEQLYLRSFNDVGYLRQHKNSKLITLR